MSPVLPFCFCYVLWIGKCKFSCCKWSVQRRSPEEIWTGPDVKTISLFTVSMKSNQTQLLLTPCRWSPTESSHSSIELWTNKKCLSNDLQLNKLSHIASCIPFSHVWPLCKRTERTSVEQMWLFLFFFCVCVALFMYDVCKMRSCLK